MAMLAVSALAQAEEGGPRDARPDRDAMKAAFEAQREAFKDKAEENREAFRKSLEEKREAFRTEVEARKTEFRNANNEAKLKFWDGAKRMLGERFAMVVRNMERLQERVGEIIEDLKADGADTGTAEEYLATSEDKLEEAVVKIEEIKALLPESGEEVTPEVFEQIKLKAREAKDLLKESHNALKNAVQELKNLKGGSDDDSEESES